MKRSNFVSPTIVLTIGLILMTACTKEEPATLPSLSTTPVTNITSTTATSGGAISDDGGATIIANGLCWGTSENPTISDSKTSDNVSNGHFVSNITGLNGGTNYYVRAYATNAVGTAYGSAVSFLTLGEAPDGVTVAASNISATGATLNGTVYPNYISTTVTFEYGTTTSYGQTADVTSSPVDGNSVVNVSANISGLTAGTVYHFRLKAVNSLGIVYGADMTFTTLGQAPMATTQEANSITTVSAQLNGIVNANHLSTEVTFEWGTTTSYGNNVTATESPITGGENTDVSVNITGLTAGTIYHFRLKTVNSLGTVYGADMAFTTLGQAPMATTQEANSITTVSAQLNGIVNANHLSTEVTFEWGTTTSYGNNVTATESPITGGENTDVSVNITGLTAGTIYHFRLKTVNSLGTVYGADMTFVTPYLIGQFAQGGIIFYLDDTGIHGLVCALIDQSAGIQWFNGTYTITGARENYEGAGKLNTITIVTNQGAGNYAAQLCADLVLSGYSDWYLPAIQELDLMYINKTIIDTALQAFGLPAIANQSYWSSTENNQYHAWRFAFDLGYHTNFGSKNLPYMVRAVRSF